MLISQRGFTIVELLIVIVVIGILATIGVVSYRGIQERAQFAQSRSELKTINDALLIYHSRNGSYPISSSWVSSSANSAFRSELVPNFLDAMPVARIGGYLYRSDSTGAEYKLVRFNNTGLNGVESSDIPTTGAQPLRNTTSSAGINRTNSWGYWSLNGANL